MPAFASCKENIKLIKPYKTTTNRDAILKNSLKLSYHALKIKQFFCLEHTVLLNHFNGKLSHLNLFAGIHKQLENQTEVLKVLLQ